MADKKPTKEQYAKFKARANDKSISAEARATFQNLVDKFKSEFETAEKEVEKVVEDKPKAKRGRKPSTSTPKKRGRKPSAKKIEQSADDIAKAKAEIKKRTGKTEEECESIIEEYKALRTKAQTRKKAETKAKEDNVKRVNKLKKDDNVIEGTTEKTADAVIETNTKDIAEKIEKEISKVEDKVEKEETAKVKKEVEKKSPNKSATEQKKEVEKKVEEKVEKKVKEKTKVVVKKVIIDTTAMLSSIAESLGKFDKDSQKEFLMKLRSDIDKLLAKYMYGGDVSGATQQLDITQSNLSASSVNPSKFANGGGVYPVFDERKLQMLSKLSKSELEQEIKKAKSSIHEDMSDKDYDNTRDFIRHAKHLIDTKFANGGGVGNGGEISMVIVYRIDGNLMISQVEVEARNEKEAYYNTRKEFEAENPNAKIEKIYTLKEHQKFENGGGVKKYEYGGYNGWTNYATWVTNLEILDGVDWRDYTDGEPITKDMLEDFVNEAIADNNELAVSYAERFLSDVNYYEIAEHINENFDLEEEDDEEYARGGEVVTTYDESQKSLRSQHYNATREEIKEFLDKKGMKEVRTKPKNRNEYSFYARGGKISKDDAIIKALKMGVDFDKDFHAQSFGNELSELAKESGYRKSKSASGSTGRAFFEHLERIYDKNKSYYDDMANDKYAKGGGVKDFEKGKWLQGKQWHIYKGYNGWVLERYKGDNLIEQYSIDIQKSDVLDDFNDEVDLIVYTPNNSGEIKIPENVQLKVISLFEKVYPKSNFGDEYDHQINVNEYSEMYARGGRMRGSRPNIRRGGMSNALRMRRGN